MKKEKKKRNKEGVSSEASDVDKVQGKPTQHPHMNGVIWISSSTCAKRLNEWGCTQATRDRKNDRSRPLIGAERANE